MAKPIDVTKETFEKEVLQSDKPVLVDFWAPWCAPCKMIAPLLEEVANERDDIKIVKINGDDQEELMAKARVRGLPTMFMMKGGVQSAMKVGAVTRKELDAFIESGL